jgi:hypothetical protein
MSISFPFKFVDLGTTPPFKIEANPDFPTETEPVCILNNLGVPPERDTFITIGAGLPPNGPDPWELTFHWATTGGPVGGAWQLDAFLESINPGVPNLQVQGFPFILTGSGSQIPGKYAQTIAVPPIGGVILTPGVFLFRLFATLRFGAAPAVRVAGRAEGPLMEFYLPV